MLSRRIALLLLAASAAFAQAKEPLRILFIGNSYTYVNDLPQMLTKLAASAPEPVRIEVDRVLVGGSTLQRHWREGKALEAIQRGNWDYVVLQEHSLLGATPAEPDAPRLAPPEQFFEFARLFNAEIRKTRARTLFYMTWAREPFPEMQAKLNDAYRRMARELSAGLAPVGLATINARIGDPSLHFYRTDRSHPSPEGTYLAACVFFAVLTGRTPLGLAAAVADDQPKPDAPKDLVRLAEPVAAYLQGVAWRTVLEDPSIDPGWTGRQ